MYSYIYILFFQINQIQSEKIFDQQSFKIFNHHYTSALNIEFLLIMFLLDMKYLPEVHSNIYRVIRKHDLEGSEDSQDTGSQLSSKGKHATLELWQSLMYLAALMVDNMRYKLGVIRSPVSR